LISWLVGKQICVELLYEKPTAPEMFADAAAHADAFIMLLNVV